MRSAEYRPDTVLVPDPVSAGRPARPHGRRTLPLRVGTRASPLALAQTRNFLSLMTRFCPVLRGMDVFEEHAMLTTGDRVLDRRLAEIGGKGLFAKEIHQALVDGRIDLAVHSLKDLETTLPDGVVLAGTLEREDASDVLILGDGCNLAADDAAYGVLPHGALIGTSSVRRQAQLLHARPDLRITMLRGNVHSRLDKIRQGACDASLLAHAGLRRLKLEVEAGVVLAPHVMVPAACQGIVGITVRAADTELRELLGGIQDPDSRDASLAERATQKLLDGTCHTPIGAYAVCEPDGRLALTGMVASEDGRFLIRRQISGLRTDAVRLGIALGKELRADSPACLFN